MISLGAATIPDQELQCEPIKLELCSALPYKSTGMPNLMGHQLQGDAKAGLETFSTLFHYGCSPDLQFFLCSVHVPSCVSLPPTSDSKEPTHQLIGPCRPLCERVKRSCLKILENFNLPWPETLDCARFPPMNNLDHMCMDGDNLSVINRGGLSSAINSLHNYPDLIRKYQDLSKKPPELEKYGPIIDILKHSVHSLKPAQTFSGKCTGVAFPVHHYYVNRTGECVPKCGVDILFDEENKQFALVWVGVWSVLCLVSTSFTLVTFLLDTERFLYPEKCVIFLSLSYFLLSLGYIVRLSSGPEGVACTAPLLLPSSNPHIPPDNLRLVVREGLSPTSSCTVVFLLLYFSSLSSAVWWTLTTATWAIIVLCSLDPKSLETKSPLLHTIGWGIPAIQTVAALVMHQVEGDELTGVCLPGQQTDSSLLHHLIIPHCVLLASACIFFLSGLVGSFMNPTDLTRRMMARLSLFFVLYTLPQACVLGSLVYELIERQGWREEASSRPNIEVFVLRIFMWLIVGITCGSWVWSSKTIQSWKKLGTRCLGFWSGSKKPATPVFPTVAYHPTMGEEMTTLGRSNGRMNTLCRREVQGGCRMEGVGQVKEGTAFLPEERRVVLGCDDNKKIVI